MVDMKFWKLYDIRITLYSGVFGVADYEFRIGFLNSIEFELILMRYSVCFPFSLIFFYLARSNRYCKFFCFDFILAISESIHNSLITSFSRPASEPKLSGSESFGFGAVTFPSKLFFDASTSYSTWEGTERLFCSCDMAMRMTTTN